MWSTWGKVCTGKSYGTLPGDADGKATEVERNTARTRREYKNTSTFGMSDGSAEMMAKDLIVDALTDFDMRKNTTIAALVIKWRVRLAVEIEVFCRAEQLLQRTHDVGFARTV